MNRHGTANYVPVTTEYLCSLLIIVHHLIIQITVQTVTVEPLSRIIGWKSFR